MTTVKLTDEQWVKIRAFVRSEPKAYLGSDENECRRFVDAADMEQGMVDTTMVGAHTCAAGAAKKRWTG